MTKKRCVLGAIIFIQILIILIAGGVLGYKEIERIKETRSEIVIKG